MLGGGGGGTKDSSARSIVSMNSVFYLITRNESYWVTSRFKKSTYVH